MLSRFPILCLSLFLALAMAALPRPAAAQAVGTDAAIERLFTGEINPNWLSGTFAAAVPPQQLAELIEEMTGAHGELIGIEGAGQQLTVRLERAVVPTQITLDAEGRIAGLFFEAPIPTVATLDELADEIAALPGRTSLLITSDGAVRAAHDADAVLAVGSAAKLAILKALDAAIAAGRLAADETVELDPAWRSLPTGILQAWPEGTPLTIATLANLMISQSDNTATDALIDLVRREAVAALTPRNTPFPTTAELFKLMARQNAGLATRWQEGDAAARTALLDEIRSMPLPAAGDLTAAPEVEWYMSATEICDLLDTLADNPAFAINPGLAAPADWVAIAYKGGSDIGVLNFSTRVVDRAGAAHCIVATWNDDTTLSAAQLATPYRGILRLLAEGAEADQ